MSTIECDEKMMRHGIRPTANRVLVMKALHKLRTAVSLFDLECLLDTIDKSTIYRILCLFADHGMLHVIEDGSGSVKYELCMSDHECSVDDMHPHFYCEVCHRTLCLRSQRIPLIDLPGGYSVTSVNYVVKGICSDCHKKPVHEKKT